MIVMQSYTTWILIAMFLYINIELINKQPIGKCFTLSYCCKEKNVALPTKGLKYFFGKSHVVCKINFVIIQNIKKNNFMKSLDDI